MILIRQFFAINTSLLSVIIINCKILLYKIFTQKKIGLFYHPKKNLTKNHTQYIEDYFSNNKEFLIFYGSLFFFNKKNYFLIKPSFLKYIYGVDIFLSNNVSDQFTSSSKKIYIHHDIFDTPLVEPKKELTLLKRLLKYDYIVVSSEQGKKIFLKLFNNTYIHPILKVSRYLKLNFFLQKIKVKHRNNCSKILIAPTNFRSFIKLSMQTKLPKIIKVLLELKFEVTYRPHPSNFFEKKVLAINEKYKKFKNFTFDQSSDYTKSFQSSDIIITDMSGTAYTYVVLNSKPVLFFNSEKEIKKFGYDELNYFKYRSQVGYIVNDIKGIVKVLNIKKIQSKKGNKIQKMRKIFLNQKLLNLNDFI